MATRPIGALRSSAVAGVFPVGFLFGAAVGAHRVEGGNAASAQWPGTVAGNWSLPA